MRQIPKTTLREECMRLADDAGNIKLHYTDLLTLCEKWAIEMVEPEMITFHRDQTVMDYQYEAKKDIIKRIKEATK